ncbi:hypothetical protein GUI43_03202 [Micromonospora noduli]|uniref:Uncharacterized protein n=1 Tax=Micromonospora noduli TaxID=709876 RepID=A0A328N707_9ACTN|nr:hypothetical protein LAH08_01635 [Micromonospora noduli]RAO08007.1 hypothetical protein LUPAC07_05937 [Micromonospora noduli]RAO11290.1 hypothetical protein GUI43_03202 [Micromonospora noduli]
MAPVGLLQTSGQWLEPGSGVRQVWAAYSPAARHGAEVTHTLNKGLTSLRAHEEYLKGLGQPDFDHE